MVQEALAAGVIDFDRARVIVDGVACLDEAPAQLVASQVLADGAGGWTVRKLGDRLRRAVVAYDAEAAIRRRRMRQADRRVQVEPHPDGTVDLYGLNLPPDRVAAIIERLTAIARTAKRQGDQRTVDQLKADVLCDLLAGTGMGAMPPEPVTNPGPTGHPDVIDEPIGEPDEAHVTGEPDDDTDSDGGGHGRDNGGPLCRREHVSKHQSGAILEQPEPGVFRWTTPLGHRYIVRPDPFVEAIGPPDTTGAAARRLACVLSPA